jgi:hypothetical protein
MVLITTVVYIGFIKAKRGFVYKEFINHVGRVVVISTTYSLENILLLLFLARINQRKRVLRYRPKKNASHRARKGARIAR